jgi:GT2 family glycosyltransferase
MATVKFPTITLLVTHYNRSKSLERLLTAFADLDVAFGDIVVSDDGSKPEHLNALRALQQVHNFNP